MALPMTDTKDAQVHSSDQHADQPPSYEPTGSSSAPLLPEDTTISSLPLCFPTDTASASDVRTYIRSFLHHSALQYDLSPANVISIAGAWRYGSGAELRSYDQATWQGLFGVELGLVLLKHVQDEVAKEKKQVIIGSWRVNVLLMVTALALILSGVVGMYSLASNLEITDPSDLEALHVAISMFWFMPFSILFIFNAVRFIWKIRQLRTAVISNGAYVRLGEEDATELRHMGTV